ncbi:hypothetical protein HMF8227_00513 [Saliniradius amylolyticus]|uniref:EF-hand domain-containing protein n=1 Tax=Saliniradius amylolyticus TaxID=2183582 RepID=A0A2S2E082_9ALTE|nr:EF-hand domain-containing protein [Saliniradius amylolyticus]AWL11009.1 hypothetical protein HMF8227_00513 [Saliniradius amylolyticus]
MRKAVFSIPFVISAVAMATPQSFMLLDTDNDGVISYQEASADQILAGDFSRFDINGDGVLSQAEYRRYRHS